MPCPAGLRAVAACGEPEVVPSGDLHDHLRRTWPRDVDDPGAAVTALLERGADRAWEEV